MNRIKMPKRILSGIICVLVVWVLVGVGVVSAVVSTPIVEEPLGENSAQTIAIGDEVVGLRTETSKTYYLGNSTYRLISTGPLHYEDEQGDWQQIDNAIVGGQMLKDAYHLSIIQEDFDEGQVLEWSVEGEYVRFQPMALGWTNYYDMWDEISMPQAVTSSVVNTPMPLLEEGDGYSQGKVVWDNAYGTGRNFQWTSTPHKLEKLLTLDTAPPVPAEYIIDGGNPTLRLSFIFDPSADLDIYVDGALWNKTTKVTTFNAIEFRKGGETLWVFNPAVYWDDAGETQIGETTLRRVGSDLWVDVLVPYEWLQTASYPVFIDPTLTVQPSSKDTYMQSGLPTLASGTSNNLKCGFDIVMVNIMRPVVEFSILGLPTGATVNTATMSLYYYLAAGTPAGNTHYAYRLLRRDWVEAQATWNIYKTGSSWTTAGASGSGTDYTTTDGASTTVPGSYGWMNWVITNQVITAYDNSWTVDCRIHSSAEATDESAYYYSKEYTGDTSLRPKLVIDYTVVPVVDTAACSNPTSSSLQANGEITDDGGLTVTRRGFVHAEGLNYALDFNGVSDYVEIPYLADYYSNTVATENFEWGIDTDPLSDSGGSVTWTIGGVGGTSKAEIDTAQHYQGTRSARLYRDGTNTPYANFAQTGGTGDDISVWVRKDDTSNLFVLHGDGTNAIYLQYNTAEALYYNGPDNTWHDTGTTIGVNTWALLELKNINWGTGKYDIYQNGVIAQSGADMRVTSAWADMVRFQNSYGTNSEVWYDNILVGSPSVWTFETWINRKVDSGALERILSYSDDSDYDRFIQISGSDTVTSGFKDTTGTARYVSTTDTIPLNTDVHLSTSFDGTYVRIYIDGVLKATSASFAGKIPRNSNYPVRIGRLQTSYNFEGTEDDIRIWEDVRTQDEIQANMYSELVGTEAGLVGYWKLNEGADTTAEDSTSNENDGTITGADWVYQGWDLKTMEDDISQTEYDTAQKLYSGSVTRRGQKLPVLNGYVDSLSFYLNKSGSPSGDVTFTVRDLADNVLATKVLGDASTLQVTATLEEATFTTAIFVNEWVRISVEYSGGDVSNYVVFNAESSDLTPIGYSTRYWGTWADDTGLDCAYVLGYTPYTYEDGSFAEGVYDLTIEDLTPETWYRVRAFAETSAGRGYGDVVTCQTEAEAAGYSFGVVIG